MTRDVSGAAEAAKLAGRPRRFRFSAEKQPRYTHYLFRYPAKFHPPVARGLLHEFTQPGGRVLDPFCGSGTLLVEAALAGRHAVGHDVDPLAVFVSGVKSKPLRTSALQTTLDRIQEATATLERPAGEYKARMFMDLSRASFIEEAKGLSVPAILNLEHWFRRYVIIDLARLLKTIRAVDAPATHRAFFELCFASIIRASSNADPVPISGLEVTRHMRKLDDEGRLVNPFQRFRRAAKRALDDMESYAGAVDPDSRVHVRRQDATELASPRVKYDAVITSPPYHGAVDYYRRHQLEMFWLDLTKTQGERLDLLSQYIGRPWPPARHPFVKEAEILSARAATLERRIRRTHEQRANAFKHYVVAMTRVFERLAVTLRPGSPAVLVVGHSSWNGDNLNTSQLFAELASPHFGLKDRLWYPVKNRYMSYSRHNAANIDREYVLVFERSNGS